MLSLDRRHRTLSRFGHQLLLVLGLAAGTLLVAAGPGPQPASCVDVYQNGYGTTCAPPEPGEAGHVASAGDARGRAAQVLRSEGVRHLFGKSR